jgi:hypothetical protein
MDIQSRIVSGEIQHATSELASLQPREGFKLTPELQILFLELESFDAPYLEECLLNKGVFRDHKEYAIAFREFKKFVILNAFTVEPLAMASPAVDEVWHQFILFTRHYVAFCNRFLGHYLHHEPAASSFRVNDDSQGHLFRLYQDIFGDISSLWNCGQTCSSCWTCKSGVA